MLLLYCVPGERSRHRHAPRPRSPPQRLPGPTCDRPALPRTGPARTPRPLAPLPCREALMFAHGLTSTAPTARSPRDAHWLPREPSGLRLVEVGRDFDVVRIPSALASKVLALLGGHSPSCIEDVVSGMCLWLIPVAGARRWSLDPGQGAAVLTHGWHVVIPGERCDDRRRWIGPGPALTPADLLEDALRSLAGQPAAADRPAEPAGPAAVTALLPSPGPGRSVAADAARQHRPAADYASLCSSVLCQ